MRNQVVKSLLLTAAALSLASCGINSVPTAEENAKSKWADVQAAFQERANLIPNLANVVKGAAAQENKTFLRSQYGAHGSISPFFPCAPCALWFV